MQTTLFSYFIVFALLLRRLDMENSEITENANKASILNFSLAVSSTDSDGINMVINIQIHINKSLFKLLSFNDSLLPTRCFLFLYQISNSFFAVVGKFGPYYQ